MKKKVLSIIVPCFNEEECLPLFYEEVKKIQEIFLKENIVFELIFVDDGSKDNTLKKIKQIKEDNDLVHYISFSKNFGKEAAIFAGLKKASGDLVALMDADLQAIGKEASMNGTNTLVVNDDLFYYLQNYGFNIISLDPDTVSESTLNSIDNAFNKKTYDTIIILDNKISDSLQKLIDKYKLNIINVSSMLSEEEHTYEELMNVFIDEIRNLSAKD